MCEFKYFVIGDSPYITPHYTLLKELPAMLREARTAASKKMCETGMQHCIYAVKRYDGAAIERVDFYSPAVALNDADFYERTEAEMKGHPGCMIYATHKL